MSNYINNTGQTRLGWRVISQQEQTQSSLLLDNYSGAAAAYSLRKLNTSYTGSAIRVRRSSDNTEQNIGFNADGTLNTLSLLAFVGSGNGFVTTWYDQSGSGNNATQTTSSSQPRIVNAGIIETVGGKPAVRWLVIGGLEMVLSMNTSLSNVRSVFLNITYLSGIARVPLLGHTTAYDYHSDADVYLSSQYGANYVKNGSNYINGVSKTLATFVKSSSNSLITMIHTSASGNVNQISSDRNIGRWDWSFFTGYFSEIILYSSDQTTNRTQIESNINTYYSIYATDTDAQAFINAASITDGTQISAIDTLVTSLKSAGIWTKMKAIYPFVGGSAAQHRFNLKDPRSVDAAFYLTFYGGISHSNLGVTFNGTTGYADMKLTRSQVFTNIDGIIGMYTPTTSLAVPGVMFGVTNQVNADFAGLYDGTSLKNLMYPTTSLTYTTSLQGFNWFGVDINTTTHRSIFKNGVRVAFADGYSAISPDYKVYMAAVNRAGTSYGDNFAGIYSFAFASNTLNSTEALAFYNAVQTYQTTLGRQV